MQMSGIILLHKLYTIRILSFCAHPQSVLFIRVFYIFLVYFLYCFIRVLLPPSIYLKGFKLIDYEESDSETQSILNQKFKIDSAAARRPGTPVTTSHGRSYSQRQINHGTSSALNLNQTVSFH